MATVQHGSVTASFGLGYAVAALTIAVIDALEAYFPSFAEWAGDLFMSPWFHLPILGTVIFLAIGFAGIGGGNSGRRTAFLVGGSMVVSGVWIFTSTMVLALRGGM
jgi:hypothetical protein